MIGHIQALHHQMAQKWREVRDANDIKKLKLKRERNKKKAQEASARTQSSRNWLNKIPSLEVTR